MLITKNNNPKLYHEIFTARRNTLIAAAKLVRSKQKELTDEIQKLELLQSQTPNTQESAINYAKITTKLLNNKLLLKEILAKKVLISEVTNLSTVIFLTNSFWELTEKDEKIRKRLKKLQDCLKKEYELRNKNFIYNFFENLETLASNLTVAVLIAGFAAAAFLVPYLVFGSLVVAIALEIIIGPFALGALGAGASIIFENLIDIFSSAKSDFIIPDEPYIKLEELAALMGDNNLTLDETLNDPNAASTFKKVYTEPTMKTDLSFFSYQPLSPNPPLDEVEEEHIADNLQFSKSMA